MRTSVELRQERARVVESLRAITETAEGENRNLTAEERQAYDRHETEFSDLSERIGRAEALEQREADDARSLSGGQGGTDRPNDGQRSQGTPEEVRSAFADFVRRGRGSLTPERRALVENAAGEILVPEELETEIYRELPALTVIRQLAYVRPISTNRIRRRSLAEVAVGWGKLETNEQALTDSMPSTPTDEYSYVEDLYGLAKIGEDELDDSDVNLEAFVRDSFARALGEAEDTGFAVGTGHANHQPVGIFSGVANTQIPEIAAGGALADGTSVDDYLALIYGVPAQYRRNASFLMASSTELLISQKKDGNGQYLWQPSVQAGRPNTFKGYAINNQEDIPAVAANALVAGFGDWKAGYRILDRQGMSVQRLVELYAEEGMVGFKVKRRVGGDVVRPNAIRTLKAPAA